ncbi:MAG: hypothetical protein FKY71_08705 [Spiribacter salinus]|uniref:Uncharacterized protein n=1 Tax=Spiribacter salinus TaxID=1335746 RepID=A0A540VRP0_9GAMM|nr:MAG: hypothetical protein FKY71_08705 [Spiribacter salinus]
MKATLLLQERHLLSIDEFVELRIWRVPAPVRGSEHQYKYSLAYIASGRCLLRYDNEAGKGDHKHIDNREVPYRFTTPEQLLADFWAEVNQRRQR